jgi:hypothetical protein
MKIVNEDTRQPERKKSKSNKGSFLFILGAIWLVYVSVIGFCFEQHRKLTDKEYFTIVFNKLLLSGEMKIYEWDNTAETYLAHHPNCCRVYGNNLFGFVIGYDITVDIIYEMNDELKKQTSKSGRATHYESITYMAACGSPYRSTGEATIAPTRTISSIN